LPLLFNFALEYAIRKMRLKLNGTLQLLAYAEDVDLSTGRLQRYFKESS
jgi:transcriptional regulator GlxA family with amidase domain